MRLRDGDRIEAGNVQMWALYTPGHTAESYSFVMEDRVFTGDALFIRGTGRTDFQAGDSHQAYASIFGELLTLPDETLGYPGHDYNGMTVSTIGEEREFNPRLQVSSAEEYAKIMDNLALASPKMMDVAVPLNRAMGLSQEKGVREGWGLEAAQAIAEADGDRVLLWWTCGKKPSASMTPIFPGRSMRLMAPWTSTFAPAACCILSAPAPASA